MHTRILNLSESGMAFLAPYLTAPEQGEKIKVEFTAPSTDPIACFANVTRVELHKTYHLSREPQTFKLVAVEFDGMHPTQRNRLSKGLRAQMQKKLSQYKRRQVWNKLVWTVMDLSKKLFGNKKSSNLEKTDLS